MHFSGFKLTWNSLYIVYQSSPDFFRRTQKESLAITYLSNFRYLAPFQRYSRSKSEVVENRPKFCMFWLPIFGGSAPPEFLDLIYLMPPLSDHVAKFQGDRLRDLGGNLAKEIKKKKLEVRDRARRESARRRKSEWKVNLGIRNSSRSNSSWHMT